MSALFAVLSVMLANVVLVTLGLQAMVVLVRFNKAVANMDLCGTSGPPPRTTEGDAAPNHLSAQANAATIAREGRAKPVSEVQTIAAPAA